MAEKDDGACLALFASSPFLKERREWSALKMAAIHVDHAGPPRGMVTATGPESFGAAPPSFARSTPMLVLRL